MLDQIQTPVQILLKLIEAELLALLEEKVAFYQLREKVREIALLHPDYIIWSPDLIDREAVTDIWDKSWNRLGSVSVPATQEMIDAPMW